MDSKDPKVIPITRRLLQERVRARDDQHLDPQERATFVNSLIFQSLGLSSPEDVIAQPLYWDMVCFCCEFLNAYALGVGEESLLALTKAINSYVYSSHYSVDDSHPILGRNKIEHRKIWINRINRVSVRALENYTFYACGCQIEGNPTDKPEECFTHNKSWVYKFFDGEKIIREEEEDHDDSI